MSAKDGWGGRARRLITDNLGLKVISLVVSLGFYGFIHGAENAVRTLRVSVVSLMPPDSAGRTLLTQIPTEIAVTLRGSRTKLDDLRSDDLGSIQLDLRSGQVARVDLSPSLLHVPPSLEVEQVYPSTLDLRWDDVVTRSLRVQVARAGELAPGFIVKGTVRVEPDMVVARGPRTVLDVIQFARAAAFDVTDLVEGEYSRQLALDRAPELVAFDVESVRASVAISRGS